MVYGGMLIDPENNVTYELFADISCVLRKIVRTDRLPNRADSGNREAHLQFSCGADYFHHLHSAPPFKSDNLGITNCEPLKLRISRLWLNSCYKVSQL